MPHEKKLAHYGVQTSGIARVVTNARGSSMQTNPTVLTDAELGTLLEKRI